MSQEMLVALTGTFGLIIPELILAGTACILFLGATFVTSRRLWGTLALTALVLAGVALLVTAKPSTASAWDWFGELWHRLHRVGSESLPRPATGLPRLDATLLVVDRLALFVKALALAGGFVLVLTGWKEVAEDFAAEYFACLLFIVAGVGLTGCANELVTLFLALELISIPTYVLLVIGRTGPQAREATVKYFLLSVLSSSFLLFGFSYLYGLSGTTNLLGVLRSVQSTHLESPLADMSLVAMIMITAALGFKITAVPFHFYAPDVYQGTSIANAALLAFMPKVAGFAAFIRLFGYVTAGVSESGLALSEQAPMVFYIMAAVTMTLGNLLALLQDNLRRLLAYSSVAHAGYMLMGLSVAPSLYPEVSSGHVLSGGIDAVLFYLVAYGFMTIGAFAVLAVLDTPQRPVESVEDLAGLCRSHPFLAIVMSVCLFSLIGMPLTAGFVGKFMLFMGAVMPAPEAHPWMFRVLAFVAALNAAAGAWYYLRILTVMYFRTPAKALAPTGYACPLAAAILCAVGTILFGCYPMPLSRVTRGIVAPLAPPATAQAQR